jgi:two-component system nitrate/nitrite response regulator NarL
MEAATNPISVLLVDDHTLFRSGIRSLLQRHAEFVVVGEAADGVEGIKRAQQLQPDVILLDLNMPGMSGVETLQLMQLDGRPEGRCLRLPP